MENELHICGRIIRENPSNPCSKSLLETLHSFRKHFRKHEDYSPFSISSMTLEMRVFNRGTFSVAVNHKTSKSTPK